MDPIGKIAFVTGGAIGIGFATCHELLKAGVKNVAFCDIDIEKGQAALSELEAEFGTNRVIFMRTDVTIASELEGAFRKTLETFGGLDIVINNAGIINEKEWEKAVAVNLNAVIRGTLLAIQHMSKEKGGNGGIVVNISSICGLKPVAGSPMYNTTKHGVIALSRTLGADYHYGFTGIRMVALCPGVTYTAQFAGSTKNLYDDKWAEAWSSTLAPLDKQGPEPVGRAVLELIRNARSGTVWVSEGGKPVFQVELIVQEVEK